MYKKNKLVAKNNLFMKALLFLIGFMVFTIGSVFAMGAKTGADLLKKSKKSEQKEIEKINKKNEHGQNSIFLAYADGNIELANKLKKIGGCGKPSMKDSYKRSPIFYACDNGNSEAIEKLISIGAKISKKDAMGWTPLIYACRSGNFTAVDLLIASGSDISEVDLDGNKPIEHARALCEACLDEGKKEKASEYNSIVEYLTSHAKVASLKIELARQEQISRDKDEEIKKAKEELELASKKLIEAKNEFEVLKEKDKQCKLFIGGFKEFASEIGSSAEEIIALNEEEKNNPDKEFLEREELLNKNKELFDIGNTKNLIDIIVLLKENKEKIKEYIEKKKKKYEKLKKEEIEPEKEAISEKEFLEKEQLKAEDRLCESKSGGAKKRKNDKRRAKKFKEKEELEKKEQLEREEREFQEKANLEKERLEKLKLQEQARLEKERIEKEERARQEQARLEKERLEVEERERLEKLKRQEQVCVEREKKERLAREAIERREQEDKEKKEQLRREKIAILEKERLKQKEKELKKRKEKEKEDKFFDKLKKTNNTNDAKEQGKKIYEAKARKVESSFSDIPVLLKENEAVKKSLNFKVPCFGSTDKMSLADLIGRQNKDLESFFVEEEPVKTNQSECRSNSEFCNYGSVFANYFEGNFVKVDKLISQGFSDEINNCDYQDHSLLHLIILRAQNNKLDGSENTLNGNVKELHEKILQDMKEIIKRGEKLEREILIKQGIQIKNSDKIIWRIINKKNVSGQTPYFMALSLGLFDVAKLLKEHGAEDTQPTRLFDNFGMNPTYIAYTEGNFETVHKLRSMGITWDIKESNWFGENPIFYCVTHGFFETAKKLLDQKNSGKKENLRFNINDESKTKITPLQGAYLKRLPEVANKIITESKKYGLGECKGNILSKNSIGRSVLFYAIAANNIEALNKIRLAITHIGDEKLKQYGEFKKYFEVLLDSKFGILGEIDNKGQTPIFYACENCIFEAIKYIKMKLNDEKLFREYINMTDNDGNTPLDVAVRKWMENSKNGIDFNNLNEKYKEIIDFLRENGAKTNKTKISDRS